MTTMDTRTQLRTTLETITDAMRDLNRELAPGSECAEWQDYVADCERVLGAPPWDEPDMVVSQEFADHWLAVAAQ